MRSSAHPTRLKVAPGGHYISPPVAKVLNLVVLGEIGEARVRLALEGGPLLDIPMTDQHLADIVSQIQAYQSLQSNHQPS